MAPAPQLIDDQLYKKAAKRLKTLSQDNRSAIRLRAIVSAKEQGMEVVATVFGITTNTLRNWIKSFAKEDLAGLEYKPGRGRKSNLTEVHFDAIRKWIEEDCNIRIMEIVVRLKKTYSIQTSQSAVHRVIHFLNLSYITPRPVHYKQDKTAHEGFKKKS
jgi:transposase